MKLFNYNNLFATKGKNTFSIAIHNRPYADAYSRTKRNCSGGLFFKNKN